MTCLGLSLQVPIRPVSAAYFAKVLSQVKEGSLYRERQVLTVLIRGTPPEVGTDCLSMIRAPSMVLLFSRCPRTTSAEQTEAMKQQIVGNFISSASSQ